MSVKLTAADLFWNEFRNSCFIFVKNQRYDSMSDGISLTQYLFFGHMIEINSSLNTSIGHYVLIVTQRKYQWWKYKFYCLHSNKY